MGQRLAGLMSARVILEDREGSLWVGTRDGLIQLKDDKFILYGSRNGLPVDPVRAVFEDRQGSLWIGTVGGGLVRFHEGRMEDLRPGPGPGSASMSGRSPRAATMRSGWEPTAAACSACRPRQNRRHSSASRALANDIIRALLVDSRDRVWVGTNGGGLDCLEKGRITNFTTAHGLPDNYIYCPGRGQARTHLGRGLQRRAGRAGRGPLPRLRRRRTSSDQPVWVIHADREGDHLGRHRPRRPALDPRRPGAFASPAATACTATRPSRSSRTRRGRLWMNCNKGIYHVAKKDLLAFAAGRLSRIPCVSFGKSEGIKVTESSGPAQPAGCIDRRAGSGSPPSAASPCSTPTASTSTRSNRRWSSRKLVINDRTLAPTGPATAPPGKGNIEIAYTAISFLQVDKMRSPTASTDSTPDWVEAGNRRSAFYTNLPPGIIHVPGHRRQWRRRMEPQRRRLHLHPEALFRPDGPVPLAGGVLAALLLIAGHVLPAAGTGPGCASASWSASWTNAPCSCSTWPATTG